MNILVTSTSFQDTPGPHHELLATTGYSIDFLRGPLHENVLLRVIHKYDGIICGDDEISERVIIKGSKNKLKVISKYGVGLDKINLIVAERIGIPVTNCEGVNHITVAEHFFALLLAYVKNIPSEYYHIKSGNWTRLVGHELHGKKLGIIGLGRIGKEIAVRAKSFGLKIMAYDEKPDVTFCESIEVKICNDLDNILGESDIISLNLPLTKKTSGIISMSLIMNSLKKGCILVNTSRADLIKLETIIFGLSNKIISAYLTDVLDEEPMRPDYPLLKYDNVIITPHIGSRTYESVARQGIMAVNNLVSKLTK